MLAGAAPGAGFAGICWGTGGFCSSVLPGDHSSTAAPSMALTVKASHFRMGGVLRITI